MPQREEAAQPRVRLLSRRRPESRERMRPAEPPGPAGAVSISCGAVSPAEAGGSDQVGRWEVKRPWPAVGGWQGSCGLLHPSSTSSVWGLRLWVEVEIPSLGDLGVAWCGRNSEGFGVRPHGSMGRIPEPQCLHLPNGNNNAPSWGWVTGCNEPRLWTLSLPFLPHNVDWEPRFHRWRIFI